MLQIGSFCRNQHPVQYFRSFLPKYSFEEFSHTVDIFRFENSFGVFRAERNIVIYLGRPCDTNRDDCSRSSAICRYFIVIEGHQRLDHRNTGRHFRHVGGMMTE